LEETVSALAYAAEHTTRQDLRLQAARMLEVLDSDFRNSNPALAVELDQQSQAEAFALKVESGQANRAETLEGLKKYPQAAPDIAAYYAGSGSNGIELLPALAEALAALAPPPEASVGDRTKAINARQRLADAMQRLAPERPKPLFTSMDTTLLTRIMQAPAAQADPERLQKVFNARRLAEWPDRRSAGNFDVSPDQIRRLLGAMKEADAETYEALLAKVKEIDPRFSEADAGSERR
jgi:hypothetical protein